MVLKNFEAAGRKIISKIKDSDQHRYPALNQLTTQSTILGIKTIWAVSVKSCLIGSKNRHSSTSTMPSLRLWASVSPSDTKHDPLKAVCCTATYYTYSWQTRSLWDQMIPDIFWTAILLRSLHPSVPLCHDVVQEVNRQSEENPAKK